MYFVDRYAFAMITCIQAKTKLNGADLALFIGISHSKVSTLLRGDTYRTSAEVLQKLERAFDIAMKQEEDY